MKTYFITKNKGKFREVSSIFPGIKQLEIELPEIQEIDPEKIIQEKIKQAKKNYDGNFIVEDTSLYIESLNGLPGPLIKWFMKTLGNEGIYKLIKKTDNFKARAETIIGYSNKEIKFFKGSTIGKIVSPNGKEGFGWDPIFQPEGHKKTFAEMSPKEKNKISMRRKALNEFEKFLKNQPK